MRALPSSTQGGSRVPESGTLGSVRGPSAMTVPTHLAGDSLLPLKNSLFFKIFSLLFCVGNFVNAGPVSQSGDDQIDVGQWTIGTDEEALHRRNVALDFDMGKIGSDTVCEFGSFMVRGR